MLTLALIMLASSDTELVGPLVSDEVRAVISKHKDDFGAEVETELLALEANGDQSASALLGEILQFSNRPGGRDVRRACAHSEKAPTIASAVHNLATCHFDGVGLPKDLPKARQLYARASAMGMNKAKCALGNMMMDGIGGPVDMAGGLALCREAAEAGEVDAQTDYGGYLLVGKGLPRDPVAARKMLTPAAEKGQRNAAFLLGQIYWKGDGVESSRPTAANWWIRAYEGGRPDAAFLIANTAMAIIADALKAKKPVPTFVIDQAKKWYAIAASEDPSEEKRVRAKEALDLVNSLPVSSPSK